VLGTLSQFAARPRRATPRSGQSLVEFALIVPIALLLLVSVADFARWYTTAIAVESATREAADFGAFSNANWSPGNVASTEAQMRTRACTAASSLTDYAGDAPAAGMTCTNPTFAYELEVPAGVTDCSLATNDPPCRVHVTLTYTFRLLTGYLPLPASVTFTRESRFAISSLGVP
jgi:Flp pilus assembly protein TadG